MLKKSILLFLVTILLSSCKSNETQIKSEEKLSLVAEPDGKMLNLVVSNLNGKVYKAESQENMSALSILNDDYTNKPKLIKQSDMEFDGGAGGISDLTMPSVREDSKFKYFDIDSKSNCDIDKDLDIKFIYNSYCFENVKSEESINRVYDLRTNSFKNLEKDLAGVFVKNGKLYGEKIYYDKGWIHIYYELNENFEVVKEFSEKEYNSNENAVNGIHRITAEYDGITIGEHKYFIAEDLNSMFIVDELNNIVSKKYNCTKLSRCNYYYGAAGSNSKPKSINDIIFRRTENNEYIYFTLKKELYRMSLDNRKPYNVIDTDAEFKDGENNCYARIKDGMVTVYDLDDDRKVATFQFAAKDSKDKEIYLNSFQLADNFVYGTFAYDESDLRNSLIRFFTIDGKLYFSHYVVDEYDDVEVNGKKIKVVILQDKAMSDNAMVVDTKTLEVVKYLNNICNYNSVCDINFGNKKYYRVNVDKYGTLWDLYDKNFNLIDSNVITSDGTGTWIDVGRELLVYRKKIIFDEEAEKTTAWKGLPAKIIMRDTNMNIVREVESDKLAKLLTTSDGKDYVLLPEYDGDNNLIERVYSKENEVKELPTWKEFLYLENKYLLITNNEVKLLNSGYFLKTKEKGYLIDNNLNILKELSSDEYNLVESGKTKEVKDIGAFYIFNNYSKYGKKYLTDDKGKVIKKVTSDYDIVFYDDCYTYVEDSVFYVKDYNHNILYKENIVENKK